MPQGLLPGLVVGQCASGAEHAASNSDRGRPDDVGIFRFGLWPAGFRPCGLWRFGFPRGADFSDVFELPLGGFPESPISAFAGFNLLFLFVCQRPARRVFRL